MHCSNLSFIKTIRLFLSKKLFFSLFIALSVFVQQTGWTNDLPPCFEIDQLNREMTPELLSNSMIACVQAKKIEPAFMLFALSGVYGYFDSLRIKDHQVHEIIGVMRLVAYSIMGSSSSKELREYAIQQMNDPKVSQRVCQQIRDIGYPNYFPRYMLVHSKEFELDNENKQQGDPSAKTEDAPFTSPQVFDSVFRDALVENFDPQLAWELSLSNYLQCSTK